MDKNIEIRTRRLIIRPFSQDYLEEYYRQFTPEITRYQYPESFPDLRAADRLVSGFVKASGRPVPSGQDGRISVLPM